MFTQRLVKDPPADITRADRQWTEFDQAVDLVDVHLVIDVEVTDQRLAVASADRPALGLRQNASRFRRCSEWPAGKQRRCLQKNG